MGMRYIASLMSLLIWGVIHGKLQFFQTVLLGMYSSTAKYGTLNDLSWFQSKSASQKDIRD